MIFFRCFQTKLWFRNRKNLQEVGKKYRETDMVYSKVIEILINFIKLKKSLTFLCEHVYTLAKVSIDSIEAFVLLPLFGVMGRARQPFLLN